MAADTALVRSDHAHRGEKRRCLVGKDAREGCEVPGLARMGLREADNLHIPPRPGPLRSRSTHAFPVTGACFLAWYPVSLALPCPPADKISFSFFLPFSFSFFLSLSLSLFLYVNFKNYRVFIDLQYCVGFKCTENMGIPGGSVGKKGKTHLQCRRPGFDPWIGKIPWRRK